MRDYGCFQVKASTYHLHYLDHGNHRIGSKLPDIGYHLDYYCEYIELHFAKCRRIQ